jgi:hypothetical protein
MIPRKKNYMPGRVEVVVYQSVWEKLITVMHDFTPRTFVRARKEDRGETY